MKKMVVAILWFAMLVCSTSAQAGNDNPFIAVDFEALTVSTTAVGLDTSKINTTTQGEVTRRVMCNVETANVRMRIDGTAPTTTVGHILNDGDTVILGSSRDVVNARWIRDDSTDATLACHYFN